MVFFLMFVFLFFFSCCSYSLIYINLLMYFCLTLFSIPPLFSSFFHHLLIFFPFISHLARCFGFVFQFVLQIVLPLIGRYHFLVSFAHQVNFLYFIFFELYWFCSCVHIYVFNYFCYYLLDFVFIIYLGLISYFLF